MTICLRSKSQQTPVDITTHEKSTGGVRRLTVDLIQIILQSGAHSNWFSENVGASAPPRARKASSLPQAMVKMFWWT